MYQAWLLLLVSLSSYVLAFYPYQEPRLQSSETYDRSSNSKRFYPVQQQRQHASQTGSTSGSGVKLDLHKVPKQKRDENAFAVVISNPATYGPNSLAISQDGSDYSYFSTMQFGSEKQEMYMLIDTGSANTWVFSSTCRSETCNVHNTFGSEDSTTLRLSQAEQWSLAYGTGEVNGHIGNDTVGLANYTVTMPFGLATEASDDFDNYPMDGILGLGRKASGALGTPTIMDILDDQGHLSSNVVGVHLHRAADKTKDGEIVFGGIDTDKFSGSLVYTKTANADGWEIPVEDFVVDGNSVNFKDRTAIIDTGTTYILLPPGDAKALHGLISGSVANGESYTLPCSTSVKLEVRISGKLYGISPKDYVGKPISTGSPTCSSTIIGHQAFGDKQWILGDVFLKNVYAVFDFDEERIGLGLPGSGGSTEQPSSSSSSASSNTAAVTPSSSGSSTSTSSGTAISASESATSTSTGNSDSSIGQDAADSAAGHLIIGYWKIGFSILVTFRVGINVLGL